MTKLLPLLAAAPLAGTATVAQRAPAPTSTTAPAAQPNGPGPARTDEQL